MILDGADKVLSSFSDGLREVFTCSNTWLGASAGYLAMVMHDGDEMTGTLLFNAVGTGIVCFVIYLYLIIREGRKIRVEEAE